ncbi:MAG: amino acid adenylation domain-containing protein [bacterium]|nr:amino acid adenylation domain-containing protein [bacterium]
MIDVKSKIENMSKEELVLFRNELKRKGFRLSDDNQILRRKAKNEDSASLIKTIPEMEDFETSHAQRRLWVLDQLKEKSIIYNMPTAFYLKGEFNEVAFQKSFSYVLERHESLRTVFISKAGEPRQKILHKPDFKAEIIDLRESENKQGKIEEFAKKDISEQFDLEKGPLIRFKILRLDKDLCLIFFNMHHIISDGWSMNILTFDLLKSYNCFRLKKTPDLQELKIQYKDYSAWQSSMLESSKLKEQKRYWLEKLSGEIPSLNLPSENVRPSVMSYNGNCIEFLIPDDICKRINDLCNKNQISIFIMLQALLKVLFYRYTGQEDIILGSPIAGRVHEDLNSQIGCYINTLVFRDNVKSELTFTDFLKSVGETCFDAFNNQDYPFDKLVEDLDIKRDISRSPLFDIMLIVQNNDVTDISFDGLEITPFDSENPTSKFDLSLYFSENENGLECSFEYNCDIFSSARIKSMKDHFKTLINSVLENPDLKVKDLEIISQEEKNKLLYQFNDTKNDYSYDKTIIDLFEEQVVKTPQKIAVVFDDIQLTYKELNEKANIVGQYLRINYNIQPDDLVGVLLERSEKMIIALWGIIKSGAAYVPIDPNYPEERVDFILKDASPKVVISNNSEGIYLSISKILESENSIADLEHLSDSGNLAYVIYTSGSTGKPKGTLIEHGSLANRLDWMQRNYSIGLGDVILQKTTYTFDVSVWELFWWSLYGSTVCLLNPGGESDPEAIIDAIEKNNVSVIHFVPSMFNQFLSNINSNKSLDRIKSLNYIFSSGEELKLEYVKKSELIIKQNKSKLVNLYGPTEATIDVTYFNCENPSSLIPIGKPISNTSLYIIDKVDNLTPIGISGELCISGAGLARGYLNRPDLTSEKFTVNPFDSNKRMYRTGDLARWLPDGNIEYLGRIDNQVKIRGFRIELGEIENTINQFEEVQEAIVLLKNISSGNRILCAYIVLKKDAKDNVKNQLKTILPHYLIPDSFCIIKKMPINLNGKIDRNALLSIKKDTRKQSRLLPKNYYENTIAKIWEDILGIDELFIEDDFFEIGGNSINIIQVANRIREELDFNMPTANLMVYTTIKDLSEHLTNLDKCNNKNLKHVFKLNKSKSTKKIFIIHGADADIFYYRHLAKELEDEYCIYGIQPEGLDGKKPLPSSYFQMIYNYIEEIKLVQDKGPYILAGYCIGGYFANCIVKLFEIQGISVKALIHLNMDQFISKKFRNKTILYTKVLEAVDKLRRLLRRDESFTLKTYMKLIPKMTPISKERQMELLNDKEALAYYFKHDLPWKSLFMHWGFVKSPILWIRAIEDNDMPEHKLDLLKEMVKSPVEFHDVPGAHKTLLQPPLVSNVSNVIKNYLRII